MMSILDKLWEKAERDEEKMFRLLLFIEDMKPNVFTKALRELVHHYVESKKASAG